MSSLFEQTIKVDKEVVALAVAEHWGLQLGDIIKASQNHTFAAEQPSTGARFAVRVTPDPTEKHLPRIRDELLFVSFLAKQGLDHVCGPVAAQSSGAGSSSSDSNSAEIADLYRTAGGLVISVYQWARGGPVSFAEYQWLTDGELIGAWGRFLASLHQLSRSFSQLHPDVACRMQRWDQVHQCVLAGAPLDPLDEEAAADPQRYGVLHGDLNISNFFYDGERGVLSVFDWDQAQQGWFLLDVAQASHTAVMLYEFGSIMEGADVPQADPSRFIDHIVQGYESVAGPGSVDRAALLRMIKLRKHFYEVFCRRAQKEGAPPDMAPFIDFIVRSFDAPKRVFL